MIKECFKEGLDRKTGATAEEVVVELECSGCKAVVMLQRR